MPEEPRKNPTWLDRVSDGPAGPRPEPAWEPAEWDVEEPAKPRPWDGDDVQRPGFELAGPAVEDEPPFGGREEDEADVRAEVDLGAIPESAGTALEENVGLSVKRLRRTALAMAHRDAEADLPATEAEGLSESEEELRERCSALFAAWQARERDRLNSLVAETEGRITRILGEIGLDVDRFERVTGELYRLKKRWEASRSLVRATLEEEQEGETEEKGGTRVFKTRWYALAIGFLGLVEFLANAPVFGALLPRDPLTEQQLRFVSETSQGWLAGALRVVSNFILRPDAALLAAGVVTFLCVLAHFFGHSLRSLLVHGAASRSGETVAQRSASEYVVPMILAGIGLFFVLGVLFEARVTLGRVAEERFAQDSVKIEELRRNASWLRVDGNLVAANEQTNRADDLEALATEQREYAASMSGLSFPILLLNTTLVLVAVCAAYFHLRDRRRDRFNERPFESQRGSLIELGDAVQERLTESMALAVRHIGDLRALMSEQPLREGPALAHQLEATVMAYRAENGRLRGLDPRQIGAFREPVDLRLEVAEVQARELLMRDSDEYEGERRRLRERFEDTRENFSRDAATW